MAYSGGCLRKNLLLKHILARRHCGFLFSTPFTKIPNWHLNKLLVKFILWQVLEIVSLVSFLSNYPERQLSKRPWEFWCSQGCQIYKYMLNTKNGGFTPDKSRGPKASRDLSGVKMTFEVFNEYTCQEKQCFKIWRRLLNIVPEK